MRYVRAFSMSTPVFLKRAFYIAAYASYRIFCFFSRPTLEGVQIIIRCRDEYLLIRHTYRNFTTYDFVGGRKDKKETFEEAAQRELFEESGIAVPVQLVAGNVTGGDDFQKVQFSLYEVEVAAKVLALDKGEIHHGIWRSKSEVEQKLSPFSKYVWRLYLEKKGL